MPDRTRQRVISPANQELISDFQRLVDDGVDRFTAMRTQPRQVHRTPRPPGLWPRRSTVAAGQSRYEYQCARGAPKCQLYGQPYMRTDPRKIGYIFRIRPNHTRWGQGTAYDYSVNPVLAQKCIWRANLASDDRANKSRRAACVSRIALVMAD